MVTNTDEMAVIKRRNRKIENWMGRAMCVGVGVMFGYMGVSFLNDANNMPVLNKVQNLEQATEILSTYSGNSPGTAVYEALVLVEKSFVANAGYTQEFLALEKDLNTVIDGGIDGLTAPVMYQPILKNLAAEVGSLAIKQESKEVTSRMGYIMLIGGAVCLAMIPIEMAYSNSNKKREEN
jgi:hypothetical protein